ncbi:MAG: hypothetical protein AAGA08_14495 [Pseudomonadota bacterium]
MADKNQDQFERLLLLLGRLNYTWTNTESLLIHFIAGLSKTNKDTAVVIFLTLNTMRARVDLVERLAKMDSVDPEKREAVLSLTRQMLKLSRLRNQYNHSIYAFDPESGAASAILMRIADRKRDIKVGKATQIDQSALQEIEQAISDLTELNARIWSTIVAHSYPQ